MRRSMWVAAAVVAGVAVALPCVGGGYAFYSQLIAESEAGLEGARERVLPRGGPAVHPSQRPQ